MFGAEVRKLWLRRSYNAFSWRGAQTAEEVPVQTGGLPAYRRTGTVSALTVSGRR